MDATWNLRMIMGLSPDVLYKLEEDVYMNFTVMVYHTIYMLKKRGDRHKVFDILKFEAPQLDFTHGTKQKVTSFMIRHLPYLYIDLFYLYGQLVYRKVWKIWARQ